MKAEEAARAFADEVAEVIDEVRDLVKKAEARALRWEHLHDHRTEQFKEAIRQRDELLAAAKAYLEREPTYPKTSYLGEMRIKLEAVIEKVEKNA